MGGEVSADAEQPELQKGSARVFDIITGIFSAIIPALVAGGIVKGILAAIAAFGIDTGAGDFAIFNMISDIPFYFLPFLLAMSTADKFRVNRSLALCVAGSLMYPTIVNAVGTGETPLALFGFTVPIFSYADSVFPVIFGVIGLSFVYRAIDKVVPDLFKLVVVPALSLAIVIPVNLFVVAPIGAWCGLGLANGIVWLFSTLGPVAGFLLGFFMPLPSMGSNSSYTDPTLAPMITCHCPSLTCAPKAPSSVLRASRSALLSSFRLNLSLVMQCVAITTLSAPPTSSRTRAASSFLSATAITPTQDPRH